MKLGMILAGGIGKRFEKTEPGKNKTVAPLAGKPLVMYGVELFEKTMDGVVVVVGVNSEAIKEVVGEHRVEWAIQSQPLGTGDATKAGVAKILELGWNPAVVVVGYADHMMFYTPEVVSQLTEFCHTEHAAVGILSTEFTDPDKLAWGRIIRANNGEVVRIVEQKNANAEEKLVKEVNPGFYCFDFGFLAKAVGKIEPNSVNGEYYITDLIEIARTANQKVVAMKIPFDLVGYGINTREELEKDQQLKGLSKDGK